MAFVLILACRAQCKAQDGGYWRASSSTAKAITGDIAISSTKITINYTAFTIAQIRKLTPAEVAAVFDADANAGINGDLYRLSVPPDKRFLHHNTLCGSDETRWMATYISGRTLQVAFFSGEDMPVFTFDAMQNSSVLCGNFTYSR